MTPGDPQRVIGALDVAPPRRRAGGGYRPRSVLGISDDHAATDGNLKRTYMAEFAEQRPARG